MPRLADHPGFPTWIPDPPRYGAANLVLFGRRAGLPCVLKICWPEHDAAAEAVALRTWAGNSAVRLLDAAPEPGALLLERLDDIRSLRDLPLPERLVHADLHYGNVLSANSTRVSTERGPGPLPPAPRRAHLTGVYRDEVPPRGLGRVPIRCCGDLMQVIDSGRPTSPSRAVRQQVGGASFLLLELLSLHRTPLAVAVPRQIAHVADRDLLARW